jgi:MFS family permease
MAATSRCESNGWGSISTVATEPASPSNAPGRPSMFAALAVRDFRLLFMGLVLGQAMMPLQFVVQIFWVQEHADPAIRIVLIGLIGTTRGAGALAFGLFGGALADRLDRRKLLMTTQGGAFALNVSIAAVMLLSDGGAAGLTIFFVLTFCAAAMSAVDGPTRQAIVPEILGPRLTSGGIALNTAGMQLSMPISIFAVGFLVDGLGFFPTYALSATGYLIQITMLLLMTYRSGFVVRRKGGVGETFGDIAAGLRYTRHHPALMWIILLMLAMTGTGFAATANLGPTWVTTVVGASYRQFSFIALTWGLGAFAASSLLMRFSMFEQKGRLLSIGTSLFAVSFLLFAVGHTWQFAVVGNLGLGIGMTTAQISATSLIAHLAPNEVRGRVMSLLGLNMGVAQLLTLPIAALGQAYSLETLFPVLALLCLSMVAAIILTQPGVRQARVPRFETASVAGPAGDR